MLAGSHTLWIVFGMGVEVAACHHVTPVCSIYVWILLNVNIDKLNFEFGTLGCDSILAGILYDNNINISNPSLDIITTHVHLTEYRTYTVDNRLYGKYCLIEAGHLEDESKISFMNYLWKIFIINIFMY